MSNRKDKIRLDSHLTEEQLSKCQEAFDIFDVEDSGQIPTDDFITVLRKLGRDDLAGWFIKHCLPSHECQNGVSFIQLVKLIEANEDASDWKNEQLIKETFDAFDKNSNGRISPNELKSAMESLGERLSKKQLKQMMKEADLNSDGAIDYQEFKILVKRIFDVASRPNQQS